MSWRPLNMSSTGSNIDLFAAAGLAVAAFALLGAGLVDAEVVEGLLTANAPDGSVSASYVADVRFRSVLCGGTLLLIAGCVATFGLIGTGGDVLRASGRPSSRPNDGRPEAPTPPQVAPEPIDWRLPFPEMLLLAVAVISRGVLIAMPLRYDEAFTLA